MGILKVNGVFDKKLMPERNDYCVYSLMDDDKNIVYVGQSKDLKQRIFSHLSSDKEFSYIEWCVCSKEEMNNLEAEGIVNSKNSKNKSLPKNDLYISVSRIRKEILEQVTATTNDMDFVFTSGTSIKYVTRANYDNVMDLFYSFNEQLKAEVK